MNLKTYCGPDASGKEKVICEDKSWYYGYLTDEQFGIPHGFGAHYDKDNNYIEGGMWEYGKLKKSYTYEEYCIHEGITQ